MNAMTCSSASTLTSNTQIKFNIPLGLIWIGNDRWMLAYFIKLKIEFDFKWYRQSGYLFVCSCFCSWYMFPRYMYATQSLRLCAVIRLKSEPKRKWFALNQRANEIQNVMNSLRECTVRGFAKVLSFPHHNIEALV